MSQTTMENEPSVTNYQIAAEQLVEAIENQEEEVSFHKFDSYHNQLHLPNVNNCFSILQDIIPV